MTIHTATLQDLDKLSPLFDAYRIFYKQESNLKAARDFLELRLKNKESVIFLAVSEKGIPLGFTQLYPSFSSVSMKQTFILNDLYVVSEGRNKGVGKTLLNHAKEFAVKKNAKGLTLETEKNNPAQFLYEKNGWKKDTSLHYYWTLN